ncbi:cytochrome c oxidase subunit 7A2, mitochondrial [Cephus cinctus]|uniref:Cytochrome c oxidase subunit 7A2, mitochondrial n=1 Tax=Cephus cinctus TaxID=211228 RepID=A0AAJ7BHT4_CEPCN|nr:cytochrome c oxidase subunit 7A2, mitochondrial [Cephus cinctus]
MYSYHKEMLLRKMLTLTNILKVQPYNSRCVPTISKRVMSTEWSNYSPKFKAFKAKQAAMQCDDGLPVYLKGGTFDKFLLNLTVALTIYGLGSSLRFLYSLTTN